MIQNSYTFSCTPGPIPYPIFFSREYHKTKVFGTNEGFLRLLEHAIAGYLASVIAPTGCVKTSQRFAMDSLFDGDRNGFSASILQTNIDLGFLLKMDQAGLEILVARITEQVDRWSSRRK